MQDFELVSRMEETARQILILPVEAQNEFYKELLRMGFDQAEVENLMKYVSLYRMFTDQRYYKVMKQAVSTLVWNDFNENKGGRNDA